jgi:hypothetical protein
MYQSLGKGLKKTICDVGASNKGGKDAWKKDKPLPHNNRKKNMNIILNIKKNLSKQYD